MLPVTFFETYPKSGRRKAHESINDLNTHRATKAQIFFPASESRAFTRTDAGQVFENRLLPADARMPHPELVQMHKGIINQQPREETDAQLKEFYKEELELRQSEEAKKADREKKATFVYEGERSTFKIRDIKVSEHSVGRNGRNQYGVGARYGVPHQDRKKGQVKIPTKV